MPVQKGILVDRQVLFEKTEIPDKKVHDQKDVEKGKAKVADAGDQEKARKNLNQGHEDMRITNMENSYTTSEFLLKGTICSMNAKSVIIVPQLVNLFLHTSLET